MPNGTSADRGAYVHYDHEALIGILVLEAHRAGAVVVGEDLGVVPPYAREHLLERGILGTSILWFEQADGGLLHRYLAQTPSKMLGVALCDLVGDRRIINQPGTNNEYPNWRVPLSGPDGVPISLEDVMKAALPRRIAARMLHDG